MIKARTQGGQTTMKQEKEREHLKSSSMQLVTQNREITWRVAQCDLIAEGFRAEREHLAVI
jgi:hypothetical protein